MSVFAAYIQRIGAEELNFRRYIIKLHRGPYYVERAIIRITPDRKLVCSNKEFAPTKEELTAIEEELKSAVFPKSIPATNIKGLKDKTLGGALYEFWTRKGSDPGIVMVQERLPPGSTGKYRPWSFFSDGKWRCMEPDSKLPFWKPKTKRKGIARIMIHEGAKPAYLVDDLLYNPERKQELEQHPFGEFLRLYEHWGMIGGALAPHRTDYDDMDDAEEYIYVCDNDWPGKAVLQEVSRHFGRALKGIKFDPRFPASWDLGDEVPKTLFTEEGRYIGPKITQLLEAATWATEMVQSDGPGRPAAILRQSFREEWFHSIKPEVFVHKDFPQEMWSMNEFNSKVMPYSNIDDTARLLKKDAASKSAQLKYAPHLEKGIYTDKAGGRYINTHCGSSITPEKGNASPFLDFMEHLIPDEGDRKELLRWTATIIARPEVKMLYGVLLISEVQGVGKGTLGEKVLAPLLGEWNVSFPSEHEIVDSNFNYWMTHKRLAVIHEIYAGHSAKAYNKLKSVITDRFVTVNRKYLAEYEMENWIHVFACSNSMRAIQLSVDDRRWFVPKVTEEKKSAEYWIALNNWLEEKGGLGIVKWWAEEFLKKESPVLKGDDAPWSVLKRQVIEEGYSPGQLLVSNFLERLSEEMKEKKFCERVCGVNEKKKNGGVILLDTSLVQLIKDTMYEGRHNDRLEKPITIRKIAKSKGWFISDGKCNVDKWGTKGSSARLICSTAELSRRLPVELASELRPIDVTKLANEWKLL